MCCIFMTEYKPETLEQLSRELEWVQDTFEHLGKSNQDIAEMARSLRTCIDTKIIDPELCKPLEKRNPYSNRVVELAGVLCEYNSV